MSEALLKDGNQPAGRTGRRHHQPVFILAPARSYSTVTTALLAGHPDIFGFPEMLLFNAPTVGELLVDRRRSPDLLPQWVQSHLSGVYRAVAELQEGSQSDLAVARASSWLTQRAHWPMTRLMDHLLELIHPRIGLEKSPDTIGSDQSLAACLDAYPLARYIHLTRHPADTQRSMHEHWRYSTRSPLAEDALVAHSATAWYLGHTRVVTALAGLPRNQWIRVRAEDLLREPFAWLPRILDWLGLPCNSEIITMMLRTEQWRFAGTGTSGRLYGGDPKFMKSPVLRPVPAPRPVSFDSSWGLPDEACRRMKLLARNLGY